MHEISPFQTGHAYCATCKATFPRTWFKTRDAVQRDGRDFCSKKCSDTYNPQTAHQGVVALMSGNMSGID